MRRTDAEFGAAVRRLLGERQLTLRAAAYKTNLNHTTIMQMARGAVPRQDTIIAWARGMGEPIDKWLVLAGYAPLLGQSGTAPPHSASAGETDSSSPSAHRVTVPDDVSRVIDRALAAGDIDTAVEEAYYFVRRPEHRVILDFRAGAHGGDTRPGRVAIIRAFEHIAGVKLLPDDILF